MNLSALYPQIHVAHGVKAIELLRQPTCFDNQIVSHILVRGWAVVAVAPFL
jgi:hypothetical protein